MNYRTVVARVVAYCASSGLAALVDLTAFAVIIDAGFGGRSYLAAVATATVGARAISSAVNYAVNRHFVFVRPGSTLRYFALVAAILAASSLCTTGMSALLAGHVVWAKVLVDGVLFVIGYQVQRRWVFGRE
ncbi:MAG TPA: GtrA family protein [Tetrasphaera sp.]|nr:GtrA family protein [Tetrasphaera sp.]